MISWEAAPYFYALSENYGSPEEDYLTLYEQGRLTLEAKSVYEALLDKGPLDTLALRKASHLTSQESDTRFNKALRDLQADFKIAPIGIEQVGAWNYAFKYEIVARQYPDLPELAHEISERQARTKLAEIYFRSVGAASRGDLSKLFGWFPTPIEHTLNALEKDGIIQRGLDMPSRRGEWILPDLIGEETANRNHDNRIQYNKERLHQGIQMIDLFFSKSVAVIGLPNPSNWDMRWSKTWWCGTSTPVSLPINPTAPKSLACLLNVGKVPERIDLAVMVIPYAVVPDALRECGEAGVQAVIVISAGFREAGKEGLERELELVKIAHEYNLRLVGPNCLGVIDTFTPLNASFAAGTPPSGPMAFMSQSGALGTAVLDIALAGRLGLSKFVSLGNKADVSEIDLLRLWENDEHTRVILIYSEGMPNGQEFINVARQVTRKSPWWR
jgi:hypothetical protein